MGAIAQLVASIGPIMSMMFGMEVEQRLGTPIIEMFEAKLKANTKSVGQKALDKHYIDEFSAISAKANALKAIAQPSSEDQTAAAEAKVELDALMPKLALI